MQAFTTRAILRWVFPLSYAFHNGKTHIAIALGVKAVETGYNVSFTTMDNLMYCLKTREISRGSKWKINRIQSSELVIIVELGYLPITRDEANLFFQLISALHEQSSLIITSNKGFKDWTEFLGDAALTTAVFLQNYLPVTALY